MTARRFDPAEPLGPGRTVVEASAGTGKTFTIAAHVARLVADDGVPLERILVVTFTRAATAELEDRIRTRMVDTVRALDEPGNGAPDDEHIRFLLQGDADTLQVRRRRLADALGGFDRAHIYTLHGFAMRVLGRLGFYARLGTDLEPADVDLRLIRSVVADVLVDRFAGDATGLVPHRDLAAIGDAVTTKPDALIVPEPAIGGTPGLRADLARTLRTRIGRRLRAAGIVGYDQMLVEARDALADPAIGDAARAIMQKRFDAALVDESQDTDPIQWQIIRSIFDDTRRLVLIGDPKQSIYAFRGADVESYLSAAAGAARRTLPTNWRSDGPLIDALNALFDGVTFGDERIPYLEVEAAPQHNHARITGPGAPLTIRRFGDDIPVPRQASNRSYFYKQEARAAVAADVAAEIVVLLGSGTRIEENGSSRDVGPGDVAVLCRTRNQVQLVQQALEARGVPSVGARSGSVFTSPAAEQWRRFLHGVERPDIVTRVRLAATSDLIGVDLSDLATLGDDAVVALQARMREWRDLLHESGVPALLAAVDRHHGLAGRLLARPDGERTLTDLTHLAEAMHRAFRTRRVGSLLSWLEDQIAEAVANEEDNAEEPEARQRRLETDADAVQVQTIHAAKGLEYPVVFCPFLWDKIGAPRNAVQVPVFHDRDEPEADDGGHAPRRRLIDVGGNESPGFDDHVAWSQEEEEAEEARLLYVALTRARHRLYVWWVVQSDGTKDTKLHEILTRRGGLDLSELVAAAGGTIAEVVVDEPAAEDRYEPPAAPVPELSRARLGRRLDYEWRRVSYSSLSPDHPVAPTADTEEQPLKDDEPDPGDAEVPEESALPMGELPHGMRFGTLVHEILEHVTFDTPDLDAAVVEAVAAATTRGRWDLPAEDFAAGLAAAVRTPLTAEPDGFRLRDLPEANLRKEMWFHLPVRTAGPATTLGEIGAIVRDHLDAADPLRRYADQLASISGPRFRGFLTGAVDLTAAVPSETGDRYAVMDFKSNVMPPGGEIAVVEDYGALPLRRAMERSHYLLQSLLYQVALHRYLQWRLDGYDPARHLGGSAYLFVRGMIGPDTPVVDGERCGVFWWRPPAEMITAVSRLFAGEPA